MLLGTGPSVFPGHLPCKTAPSIPYSCRLTGYRQASPYAGPFDRPFQARRSEVVDFRALTLDVFVSDLS